MDALVERVTSGIAEAIHPDKTILFGSRAKGTATEESDIDLVVAYSAPKATRDADPHGFNLFSLLQLGKRMRQNQSRMMSLSDPCFPLAFGGSHALQR